MDLQLLAQQAVTFHQQGNLVQAEALYLQILQAEPDIFGPRYYLGMIRFQQGRHEEAADMLERALLASPNDLGALMNHGMALRAAGRSAEALDSFERALAVQPNMIEGHYNRGVALADLERHEDAVDSYSQALVLRPDFVPALGNRGGALVALRRFDDALASYDSALAISANDMTALIGRGIALASLGRFEDALTAYDRALQVQPDNAHTLFSRGLTLGELGRAAEALDAYERALTFQPDHVEALNNRGVLLAAMGRPEDAIACYDRALSFQPRHVESLINRAAALRDAARLQDSLADYETLLTVLPGNADIWQSRGVVLRGLERNEEALGSFGMAITTRPDHAEALYNRSHLLWAEKGDYEGAIADLERALKIDPSLDYARGDLLHLKMYAADWTDFEVESKALDAGVRAGKRVVRPFAYQAVSQTPADLLACSTIFAEDRYPAAPATPIARRDPGRIRIGYVSGEFRDQATAYLMAGLYEAHDRTAFEVIAIDTRGGDGSALRARLERAFDRIISIAGLSDPAAADLIRSAEIDILVNLNGYFGTPRMGVFARRPAPVQVNYLGFPATLGAPYMDYIIADKTVIPDGEARFYAEKVVHLKDSYQVNDASRAIADRTPTRAEAGLPENSFVFCNFNQSYKLTPPVFAAWMRILKQVEGSILWLLDSIPPFAANLKRAADAQGIAPERLVFAPSIAVDQHLARLKLADLFLDELPYNAHTTASDALWAGVPLVTCRGTAFPGRVAASLLTAAGLPELIAENLSEYEKLAVGLAGDPNALKSLRDRLEKNRANCALFDTARFARNIEAAYAEMFARWQRGEKPSALTV